jgi:hypothetical protein
MPFINLFSAPIVISTELFIPRVMPLPAILSGDISILPSTVVRKASACKVIAVNSVKIDKRILFIGILH